MKEYIEKWGLLAAKPQLDGQAILHFAGGPGNHGLTMDRYHEIMDLTRKGYPRSTVAAMTGISYVTLNNWLKWGAPDEVDKNGTRLNKDVYYAFHEDYLKAEAVSETEAIDLLREAGRGDWRAALEFLSRRFPDNWRPESKKIVEVGGEVEHTVRDINVERMLEDPEVAALACTLLEKLSVEDRDIIDVEVEDDD
jgi:hypothetical protein